MEVDACYNSAGESRMSRIKLHRESQDRLRHTERKGRKTGYPMSSL